MSSQFMDKQVMDLSNSLSDAAKSHSSGGNNDFIDFMNSESERKDDLVASYDFMPIRPGVGSSSTPLPASNRALNLDSVDDNVSSRRTWNSLDSNINAGSSIRNYSSVDADKPAKFVDATLVTEIDMTVKKYTDNLMHALDGVSARISQLETRTRKIESSMDDLKVSIGNNQGSSDGKMMQMENILREVQSGVRVIMDKQETIEAQMHISKMQFPNPELVKSQETAHTELSQPGASAHQQFSAVSLSHPPPTLPSPNAPMPPPPQQTMPNAPIPPPPQLSLPNAPMPPPPQQSMQSQVQFPNQISQSQIPSVPQQESYFHPPSQTPENPNQQYQIPPPHQHQHQHQHQPHPQSQHQPHPQSPNQPHPQSQHQPHPQHQHQHQLGPPQPQHQNQSASQSQYSQPPPPSQPHPSFPALSPSLTQPQLGHPHEETPYPPPQLYPPGILPPPSHSSAAVPPPPSQHFYGPTSNSYEPQSNMPGPGYPNSYGRPSGNPEPYPYTSSPSQYGSDSPRKHHQISSNAVGQSGGTAYPQLPTARILPQAIPTASSVGSGSSSVGSGNKIPIDDVVEKVANMGFSRDQVRATVKKLTENGQTVDLNIVLDKLMNDGDVQAPRGWFGR